jgi:hypothetical protein
MKIIEKGDYKIVKVTVTLDVIVGYDDEIYHHTPEEVIAYLEDSTSNDVGRLLKDSLDTAKIE